MNPIRLLRNQVELTQQALAARAQTSQPTIAMYESGQKSPTLDTLERLAAALGYELVVSYTPKMTREDSRSLTYHRAIAGILQKEAALGGRRSLGRAQQNLSRMEKQHPHARALFEGWHRWLALPVHELAQKIIDPDPLARDMRQVTPFAGLLSPKERARILKTFRKDYNR